MPARVSVPALPTVARAPRLGSWVWTCRAGFEGQLFEELAWAGARPTLLGAGLVESALRPSQAPAFGRFVFRVTEVWARPLGEWSGAALAEAAVRAVGQGPFHLQGWTPDTDAANAFSGQALTLVAAARAALPSERQLATAAQAQEQNAPLGQLCVVNGSLALVGTVGAREAVCLSAGGRTRMRRDAEAPSRAAMKLDEALEGLTVAPSRGEVCVDLGAAPGGWTQRLVARGAKVIAVDPANLTPALAASPRVEHLKASAFTYEPDGPVDWLFCDMAWRPLEVAQLLAKWGRKGWALHLVANIKLPMKDKNPLLHRVRHTLVVLGGWNHLTMRQLYHDRDEVTVTARRG